MPLLLKDLIELIGSEWFWLCLFDICAFQEISQRFKRMELAVCISWIYTHVLNRGVRGVLSPADRAK